MHAIIDVGSNSVRLMLGEGDKTLFKRVVTTRLGEGLATTGRLKDERMTLTVDAIRDFIDVANKNGVRDENVYIFATESVRSAVNGNDFVDRVYKSCGINVDVVSGEIEAKLGFDGAYSGDFVIAVVDIGGASTEITIGDTSGIRYSLSRPIGCVRIRDKCGEDKFAIKEYIESILAEYGDIPKVEKAVFVAGTASTVATMYLKDDVYDSSKVQDLYISKDDLGELIDFVEKTPQDMRRLIKGLPEGRRDIIYGGMLLIDAVLERLSLDGFYFSDRDNLEGYRKRLRREGRLKN